jgi:ankyrin repeat protein
MAINRKNIVTERDDNNSNTYNIDAYFNNFYNDFCLAINYSRYGNNFNIVCENIDFEDINFIDTNGWTPLLCAVRKSNRDSTLETVQLILKFKPNINTKNNF